MQDDTKHATSIAQQAVHTEPSSLGPRNRLASLLFQNAGVSGAENGGAGAAEEALAVLASGAAAKASNGLVGDVDAALEALSIEAVAEATIAKGNQDQDALRKAQRAIMLRPSAPRGWDTLDYVRAQSAA
ncbi:hypothetical protein D9619_001425 [Psilocybe cf. subviscida]|uniref:Uncharacterized protein n=1 Tax=Psilocybe cf. subviscida TaxID=2480587 RepID=A0A8H5F4F5_9AGAR|nr:hypothetical protein D9619_001425 [Psilocybe cf. subviscida]